MRTSSSLFIAFLALSAALSGACAAPPADDESTASQESGLDDPSTGVFEEPTADVDTSPGETDESEAAPAGLVARAPANPLPAVVGFAQINLTTTSGSCGSHASAIAAAYLRGISDAGIARDIETMIYGYAGMKARPGIATVAAAVNRYLSYRNVGWKAVVFNRSSDVAGYLAKGSPVIANTAQWGGHYVTIYGLKDGTVSFSDGANNDGVSARLGTGYLKAWPWSSFLGYARGNYIGFVRTR